jgi:clan AA aspartic protease (TIGR02281 family)
MLKFKFIFSSILSVLFVSLIGQVKIPLTKKGGVYEVPCNVNGKAANFIFDSGASDVQISKEFFIEGLKTGLFKKSDIYSDVVNFKVASGDIVAGKLVNIRKLKVGALVLYNILGSIIDSPDTPMLLGQSAIEKFGSYSIDYKTLFLSITGNKESLIETQIEKDLKNPATASTAKQKLNNRIVASSLEFEVVGIRENGSGADAFIYFTIDVTNTSNLDSKAASIYFSLEVTTEDGKRYTSINTPIITDLLTGQTSNSGVSMSVRGKKIVGLRIYSQAY